MSELITELPFPVTFHFEQKVYDDDSIVLSLDYEIADNLTFQFLYNIPTPDTDLNPIIYSMIRIVLREMSTRDAMSKEKSWELPEPKVIQLNCNNYKYSDPPFFGRIVAISERGHELPESL